jgi:hypothetical protein
LLDWLSLTWKATSERAYRTAFCSELLSAWLPGL